MTFRSTTLYGFAPAVICIEPEPAPSVNFDIAAYSYRSDKDVVLAKMDVESSHSAWTYFHCVVDFAQKDTKEAPYSRSLPLALTHEENY